MKEQADFNIRDIRDLLITEHKHAAAAIQIIAGSHLWRRFGSFHLNLGMRLVLQEGAKSLRRSLFASGPDRAPNPNQLAG